ncbi:MAG: hypothetical protein J4432_00395 [DPANN group archaeon]|nr:hypothetical protein [DPANN group archaeon]
MAAKKSTSAAKKAILIPMGMVEIARDLFKDYTDFLVEEGFFDKKEGKRLATKLIKDTTAEAKKIDIKVNSVLSTSIKELTAMQKQVRTSARNVKKAAKAKPAAKKKAANRKPAAKKATRAKKQAKRKK